MTQQTSVDAFRNAVRELVAIEDSEAAHTAWLESDAAAVFNEATYYPYTSLKYHVLLAAASLSNYRAGAVFEELYLVVDDPDEAVTPHRTVLEAGPVSLRMTADSDGRPAAALGSAPARSFADVWSRLPELPLNVDSERQWRVLDAQLRRVRSWSAALQLIEDYVDASAPDELVAALRPLAQGDTPGSLETSGYVVHSLQTALHDGLYCDSVEEAIVTAVNRGGDTDTIGAIAGAVAGARFGAAALPEQWLDAIDEAGELEGVADQLVDMA